MRASLRDAETHARGCTRVLKCAARVPWHRARTLRLQAARCMRAAVRARARGALAQAGAAAQAFAACMSSGAPSRSAASRCRYVLISSGDIPSNASPRGASLATSACGACNTAARRTLTPRDCVRDVRSGAARARLDLLRRHPFEGIVVVLLTDEAVAAQRLVHLRAHTAAARCVSAAPEARRTRARPHTARARARCSARRGGAARLRLEERRLEPRLCSSRRQRRVAVPLARGHLVVALLRCPVGEHAAARRGEVSGRARAAAAAAAARKPRRTHAKPTQYAFCHHASFCVRSPKAARSQGNSMALARWFSSFASVSARACCAAAAWRSREQRARSQLGRASASARRAHEHAPRLLHLQAAWLLRPLVAAPVARSYHYSATAARAPAATPPRPAAGCVAATGGAYRAGKTAASGWTAS
jgi:hypothetical protein